MELKLTNEEIETIKYYKERVFDNINQLLVADSRSDIAIITDEQNNNLKISYDKTSVINYIETIKIVYRAMIKSSLQKEENVLKWEFIKTVPITEIEKYKNEPYIDKFLLARLNKNNINTKRLIFISGIITYFRR